MREGELPAREAVDAMLGAMADASVTNLRVRSGETVSAAMAIDGVFGPVTAVPPWVLEDRAAVQEIASQLEAIGDLPPGGGHAWSSTRVLFGRGREAQLHSARAKVPGGSIVVFTRMVEPCREYPEPHARPSDTILALLRRGDEELRARRLLEGRRALAAAVSAAEGLGPDFPNVLSKVLVDAARSLDAACLEEEALPLLERAREIVGAGGVPPFTRLDLLDVSESVFGGLWRSADVLRIVEERIAVVAEVYGVHGPVYAEALASRALERLRREDTPGALTATEQALARAIHVWGTDEAAPFVLKLRGDALAASGDPDGAIAAATRALAIVEAVGEPAAPYLQSLAGALERAGALEPAAENLRRALTLVDPETPYGASVHVHLAYVLRQLDRVREADALVDHASRVVARLRPPGHPELRAIVEQRVRGFGPYR